MTCSECGGEHYEYVHYQNNPEDLDDYHDIEDIDGDEDEDEDYESYEENSHRYNPDDEDYENDNDDEGDDEDYENDDDDEGDDEYLDNPDDLDDEDMYYEYNPCGDDHEARRNPWTQAMPEAIENKLRYALDGLEDTLTKASEDKTNLSLLFDIAHDLGVVRASYTQGIIFGEQDDIADHANKLIMSADEHLSTALKTLRLTEESAEALEEALAAAMPWKNRRNYY